MQSYRKRQEQKDRVNQIRGLRAWPEQTAARATSNGFSMEPPAQQGFIISGKQCETSIKRRTLHKHDK
jgi:hypothetical protein